jgi:hypothetical protein
MEIAASVEVQDKKAHPRLELYRISVQRKTSMSDKVNQFDHVTFNTNDSTK